MASTPSKPRPRGKELLSTVRDEFALAARSEEGLENLVQLTGTTTLARDAILALVARHGPLDQGYLQIGGVLQREVDNKVDPRAVVVCVEGERIGYLPGYVAHGLDLSAGEGKPVNVQIFSEQLPKGPRAEAWVWLGEEKPRWRWSATSRPPMSPQAKAQARFGSQTEAIRDDLLAGGKRASRRRSGMVNGVHWLQTVEPIKQLKREGRLEDALTLCYGAMDGVEREWESSPVMPPWYYEQAAIILRKLGRTDEEIAVLERHQSHCHPDHRMGPIALRLAKLTSKR